MKATTKKKSLIITSLYITLGTLLVIYFGFLRPHYHPIPKIGGIYLATPKTIKEFHFYDSDGNTFSKRDLLGHWTFLFFGFTNCEKVCPTTLSNLNEIYKILENELPPAVLPQVFFISVDPERDTLSKLKQYTHTFNSHFKGARAEIAETIALEKQLGITTTKIGKTINHSADILLINPEGEVQALFPYPHQPLQITQDYKKIINASSG